MAPVEGEAAGRTRVAVVGSGVAGLTAAYLLRRRHDVLLFEADDRLGGHAHTHDLFDARAGALAVDSGFIVHNERTYPNLLRLFRELGVATQETEMSMSVRCLGCGLEYAGARGPAGVFARPANVVDPRFLRMLGEIKRFHRHARRLLTTDSGLGGAVVGATLGDFLAEGGYSRYFADHFLVPLVSAVWSTGPDLVLRYPARYLFEFLDHHGMLSVTGSPRWRTVVGGSRAYVERAAKGLSAVNVSTPVRAVQRHDSGATLWDEAGGRHEVDGVVLATHPNQALRMLADPSPAESAVLGAIGYARNETVLHTDASLLPRRSAARSCWNYLVPHCGTRMGPSTERAVVTYHMNRLQRFDAEDDYLVTLNATETIKEGLVLARMVYEHPVYTPESVAAQARLPELTTRITAYAGAYHGWGFHEDGCASGVTAAAAFGVRW
ncbi:MAG TPA: FAD-dependent oxidoreductase [Actinospica sp.]|jgi:predicted NAD/FAD-binding protein|nr:FAD-dependent oxidoreductase [Actinospica sp.]